MGLCRKIWQQKEGPNMLELALCGWWWGLKGLVAKQKAWAWLTKRERKWKVNYRDLDEVTECWEGNSLMEGCLRLLSCSWDEVIEAQLLCTLPELKRSPLITQSDIVCAAWHFIHLPLYWTHWLKFGWTVTREHLKPDCGIYWGIGNNPVLSGRWVQWSQDPHRPCLCKTKCECAGWTETSQLTWDHLSSGTVGSITSKWTWRTRPDSVEQLRFILCLVFVFISKIVKLLWVMSASGGARSKHCPVCRSAVWVKVQVVWGIAEGDWDKSRLYHHSYQT